MRNFLKSILKKFFEYRSRLLRSRLKIVRLGDYDMVINRDHALPMYLRNRPSYASNLPRLLLEVKKKYPDFKIVDIGANIGDTVALVRSKIDCPILCIEGEDFYFKILSKNIVQFKDVQAIKSYLGEKSEAVSVKKENSGGTLSFFESSGLKEDSSSVLNITTLDMLSREYTDLFSEVKVVKIDTDGYDLKIIRGGQDFLKKNSPIIFFEYDRFFLNRANDEGISIFHIFASMGYGSVIFFDNVGRFILSTDVNNTKIIEQLYAYTYRKCGAFPFYDVCVFPEADTDIADSFAGEEMKRNYENIV